MRYYWIDNTNVAFTEKNRHAQSCLFFSKVVRLIFRPHLQPSPEVPYGKRNKMQVLVIITRFLLLNTLGYFCC